MRNKRPLRKSSFCFNLSSMRESQLTFLEFFAGGGMARAGLGKSWRCLFANDFDPMKVATYVRNYGDADIKLADVARLTLDDLPSEPSDLAWASFPCQDLSLAGDYRGLGREGDRALTRSGTFWPFWNLMRGLGEAGRSPRTIVLENVYGCLTSHAGKDFAAIGSALSSSDYRFGAIVINASRFVPQSRPRVFFVAIDRNEVLPTDLVSHGPDPEWHPQSLVDAYAGLVPFRQKALALVEGASAAGPQHAFCRSHREQADWRRLAFTGRDGLSSQPHVVRSIERRLLRQSYQQSEWSEAFIDVREPMRMA